MTGTGHSAPLFLRGRGRSHAAVHYHSMSVYGRSLYCAAKTCDAPAWSLRRPVSDEFGALCWAPVDAHLMSAVLDL